MSANHGGDIQIALQTIQAAKKTGADAIKLQTYTADTITCDARTEHFKINHGTHWDGQYLHDLYQQAYTPWEWHKELFEAARAAGLDCFSSPFDHTAVDLLEELNTPRYKIASFEITDIPLIRYVASKQKPVIISTGIADIEDIELALKACRDEGNENVTLLKCTSAYPADPGDANLLTIPDMRARFGVEVGLSDHTMGVESAVVATALGATVIEKHFIADKSIGGPDAHFSLDTEEFTAMVDAVRTAELLLGNVDYEMTDKKKSSRHFSRSLFIVKNVEAGEIVSKENVRSIRPGVGLHPKHYNNVLGKRFTSKAEKGTPLTFEIIEE